MRALFAGLFVFVGLCVVGTAGINTLPRNTPSFVIALMMMAALLLLMLLSFFLFNRPGTARLNRMTAEERLKDLQEKGLLNVAEFKARRAFGVEEFEDEGSHYFIELEDSGVLYLNGQYLYDYELISDDPEVNQPRSFPCTEFTIRRHREEGWVVDIQCHGQVINPEITLSAFQKNDFETGLVPEDGEIIRDRSYDQIKAQLKNRRGETSL